MFTFNFDKETKAEFRRTENGNLGFKTKNFCR